MTTCEAYNLISGVTRQHTVISMCASSANTSCYMYIVQFTCFAFTFFCTLGEKSNSPTHPAKKLKLLDCCKLAVSMLVVYNNGLCIVCVCVSVDINPVLILDLEILHSIFTEFFFPVPGRKFQFTHTPS